MRIRMFLFLISIVMAAWCFSIIYHIAMRWEFAREEIVPLAKELGMESHIQQSLQRADDIRGDSPSSTNVKGTT